MRTMNSLTEPDLCSPVASSVDNSHGQTLLVPQLNKTSNQV
uniref:Uncharacterized protein n=1 Tax=Anguilla anguilla TaxID=7936 RepID=A0A0E9PUB0_ANGAN